MLEDANLDPGTLQVVLRELGGGGGGFRSNSTSTVMKDLTPPSPREGTLLSVKLVP